MYGIERCPSGVEERLFDSLMGVQAYSGVLFVAGTQTSTADSLCHGGALEGACRFVGARERPLDTPVM
jgi:hypothetical protein